MKKGNRLAAMIMAAVLAAGTLTGSVFASDFTTTGEVLSEESSNDYLNETNELIDETVPEDSALSIAPASADTDPAAVDEISSEAETEDEEGTEAVGEEEAEEETALENGQDSETPDDTGVPADETASFDGSIDETEDVSSDITDDGDMVSDEMPGADQETEEVPAPVQEDNAFTEDQTATEESAEFLTEESAEFLTEEPAAVADPAPADDDAAQTADTGISEESDTEETVSEEQKAEGEADFNPITLDYTSVDLLIGHQRTFNIKWDESGPDNHELIEFIDSDTDGIIEFTAFQYTSFEIRAKKAGSTLLTINGNEGTVLKLQINVFSCLAKDSVTVKAEYKTKVSMYEDYLTGSWEHPYDKRYSVSTSNKNIATAALEMDENDHRYYLIITGVGVGNAVISVTSDRTQGTSTISVKVEKPTFSLNATDINIQASDVYDLKSSGSNIKTATSSNTSILTVEKTGDKTVRLKPVKPGKATVTVNNYFGDVKKATVTVTTFLRFKSMTLTAGAERELSEADIFSASDYQKWGKSFTVSNKNIATVSGKTSNNSFKFKGQYLGKTTINVKCGKTGATSPIAVTVKAPAFNLSASKVTIDKVKTWQVTSSGSDIGKVSSSNTGILKVKKVSSRKVQLIPVGHGTATVTITSIYGVKRTVTAAVSYNYFKALLNAKTRPDSVTHGSKILTGKTAPSTTVSVPIGGKTYTCKVDSSGNYVIRNIPAVKAGAKLKLTFKLEGVSITKTVTVK